MTSRSPLVYRIAIVVGAIVLTAIVSMATTLAVSRSIEGNATAINQAGALRMGAFQLLARSAGAPELPEFPVQERLDQYQQKLSRNSLARTIPESDDHPLRHQYQSMLRGWETGLRPALEGHFTPATSKSTCLPSWNSR